MTIIRCARTNDSGTGGRFQRLLPAICLLYLTILLTGNVAWSAQTATTVASHLSELTYQQTPTNSQSFIAAETSNGVSNSDACQCIITSVVEENSVASDGEHVIDCIACQSDGKFKEGITTGNHSSGNRIGNINDRVGNMQKRHKFKRVIGSNAGWDVGNAQDKENELRLAVVKAELGKRHRRHLGTMINDGTTGAVGATMRLVGLSDENETNSMSNDRSNIILGVMSTAVYAPKQIEWATVAPTTAALANESFDYGSATTEEFMIKHIDMADIYRNTTIGTTTTCSPDDETCIISLHNSTCVGDEIYCNYTYEEYVDMLYDYIYPTVPEWILIFSHAVVFFMGLVGNALVCIAVYTNYTMRTVTNIFIVNLAVADFFVILFCLPPTVVWDVTETWFMGSAMCKVVLYFQTVSVTVSVLTLTFISIDRWYAICFPLRYVSTNVRAIGSIAFIWIVALLSDIPEIVFLTTKKKELRFGVDLFTQCVSTWETETEKLFYIARFVLLYILPLLMMTIAYFQIVRVLWKSDTIPGHRESRNTTYTCGYLRSSGPAANSSTMGQLRARRKAAKMLVAVVVMFASCFFPVHVLNILRYSTNLGQSEVVTVLSLFSHWLCYANSAINPVIYNFMSGKFRREFRNALEKCRCGRVRVEDRSMYHSTPASRINNISPSSRSNYQLTSLRDMNSLRDRQTMQTSFVENGGGNGNNLHNHHHHPQIAPMLLEDRLAHSKFDHSGA